MKNGETYSQSSDSQSTGNSVLPSSGVFAEDSPGAVNLKAKLFSEGMRMFQQSQADRWKQERQWYLNLAFYFGRQWVRFKGQGSASQLYTPKAPYYRARPVINQTRRIARKEISRLTSQQPNAYVVPASLDDRDVFAAQAGEAIWDSMWRDLKINSKLRQAAFWQVVCGNGYLHQWWDATAIYDRVPLEDPQEIEANNGDPFYTIYGNVALKALSPFHIYVPDLKEEELETQPWMINAVVKPNSWIRNFFKVDPIPSEGVSIVNDSLLSALDINQTPKSESSVVLEIWVKPGVMPELPDGGMWTIAGNKLVQGFDEFPYSHGEFPVSKLDSIPTGKYYTDSVIVDLIPIQRELNRSRGQIIEARNRMAKPQLAAEKGSVDASKITTEPGQVVEYRQGFNPPSPIPMQNLPSYVTEEINRLYADMSDLSGQHEVSQGSVPPGVTAAVAISFLQEQDESIISPHVDSVEEALQKTGKQALTYVVDYWDEERAVKVVGLDGAFDVKSFKGSELRNNTDIRVEAGSMLPTSRAAKQAFITDLMKMGFVDPQDGLELLEIGGLNKIYERVRVDRRQAQRENLKMAVVTEEDLQRQAQEWEQQAEHLTQEMDVGAKLEPPLIIPVNSWDNHPVHIQVHNDYRKSQAFEMADPIVKALFEEHVNQHQIAYAIQQGAMGNPLEGEPTEENPGGEETEQQPQEGAPVEGAPPGPEPMPEGVQEEMEVI